MRQLSLRNDVTALLSDGHNLAWPADTSAITWMFFTDEEH